MPGGRFSVPQTNPNAVDRVFWGNTQTLEKLFGFREAPTPWGLAPPLGWTKIAVFGVPRAVDRGVGRDAEPVRQWYYSYNYQANRFISGFIRSTDFTTIRNITVTSGPDCGKVRPSSCPRSFLATVGTWSSTSRQVTSPRRPPEGLKKPTSRFTGE